MRKATKRRHIITPKAPMCVVLSQTPDLALTELQSVEAFAGGWATTEHFDDLADCRNIMTLAAAERDDKPTLGKREANATPLEFRDELLRLAMMAHNLNSAAGEAVQGWAPL